MVFNRNLFNIWLLFSGSSIIPMCPDLPGSGQSEIIEDMTMEGLAESVFQLLQQLNVDKCMMIGHSMGGYVTLAFVEKHPELIEGYGLFHSTAFADTEEKKAGRKKTIETIKENGVVAFLKTFVRCHGHYK